MKQVNELIQKVLFRGTERQTRNAVTKSLFGEMIEFDMADGFPAVTCKKLFIKPVVGELSWFLKGGDNVRDLAELTFGDRERPTIWHDNVRAWKSPEKTHQYDAGNIYGVQWRYWGPDGDIDQLHNVVELIKKDPSNRRLLVTAWNPSELDQMCLPPCHYAFQFYVNNGNLDILVHMRSVDLFLGLPFDIASYALLLIIVSNQTGLRPGKLKMCLGDAHIYENAYDACKELISREPKILPGHIIHPTANIDNFVPDMFELQGYTSHDAIKVEMIA